MKGKKVLASILLVVMMLCGVELQGQSTWVDTWPVGRQGVSPVVDTICIDANPLDLDPCDSIFIDTIGWQPNPSSPVDSCNWTAWPAGPGCSCGGLYPGGPHYSHDTWGINYDPAHFYDSCGDHDNPTWDCGGAPQPRHLYNVPCSYQTDTNDPNHPYLKTGCFTLQIGVTHCMTGKNLQELQFDFSNYDLSCFGDSVTIMDLNTTPPDTVAFLRKDSTGTPIGGTSFLYDFGQNNTIPPPPPCVPRILTFEVCGLWKDGRSPAEHECAAVFEVKFLNSDASECGIIPFIVGGRCPDLDAEPVDRGKEPSLSYRVYYDEK
ncbi:MAG: hypothetical protein AB7H80_15190 [Candidatus Kapaibacterium sp.]